MHELGFLLRDKIYVGLKPKEMYVESFGMFQTSLSFLRQASFTTSFASLVTQYHPCHLGFERGQFLSRTSIDDDAESGFPE